jgi:hypothetical protein
MDVQQGINMHLLRTLNAQGVEFAFPTRTLHVQGFLGREQKASDDVGDRDSQVAGGS